MRCPWQFSIPSRRGRPRSDITSFILAKGFRSSFTPKGGDFAVSVIYGWCLVGHNACSIAYLQALSSENSARIMNNYSCICLQVSISCLLMNIIKVLVPEQANGPSKGTALTDTAENAQRRLAARLLSKRELAAVLKVCERTIDNWVAGRRIPRLRLSARLTRFSLPKVEAALARYEVRE